MRERDGIEMLDDQELEKVVGGVASVEDLRQQSVTEDFFLAESDSAAGSLENRIRRPLKHEVQGKRG